MVLELCINLCLHLHHGVHCLQLRADHLIPLGSLQEVLQGGHHPGAGGIGGLLHGVNVIHLSLQSGLALPCTLRGLGRNVACTTTTTTTGPATTTGSIPTREGRGSITGNITAIGTFELRLKVIVGVLVLLVMPVLLFVLVLLVFLVTVCSSACSCSASSSSASSSASSSQLIT